MSLSVRTALVAVHYRSLDEARQQLGLQRPCGARAILGRLNPPAAVQFRLRYFYEHQSTDSGTQGASDEVYISAIGTDSASVTVGPDQSPVVDLIHAPPIGDVSDDAVRNQWADNPHALVEFDLRKPGDWPRTYTVTLLIVEHDNGDLTDDFDELNAEVGGKVRDAVVAVAATATGAATGAVVGSVVPGIGTAVGAAVGALAGVVYDTLIAEIRSGLADEIFRPIPITLTIDKPWLAAQNSDIGIQKAQRVQEHGADYEILYDWHVVG